MAWLSFSEKMKIRLLVFKEPQTQQTDGQTSHDRPRLRTALRGNYAKNFLALFFCGRSVEQKETSTSALQTCMLWTTTCLSATWLSRSPRWYLAHFRVSTKHSKVCKYIIRKNMKNIVTLKSRLGVTRPANLCTICTSLNSTNLFAGDSTCIGLSSFTASPAKAI